MKSKSKVERITETIESKKTFQLQIGIMDGAAIGTGRIVAGDIPKAGGERND